MKFNGPFFLFFLFKLAADLGEAGAEEDSREGGGKYNIGFDKENKNTLFARMEPKDK